MAGLTVTMPRLHDGQREIHSDRSRYRVVCCGRRFGKSRLGTAEVTEAGLQGKRAWWVAPTFAIASIGWRVIKGLALQIPGIQIRESELRVIYPSGGSVQVKSADRPASLRGEGLDLAVMDEAAFMEAEAWYEALRPALSDRQGRALFISTPCGRNWFYELYQRGPNGDPGWRSFSRPTHANPYIVPEEIEDARRSMSETTFRQEYLAEFVVFEGQVFGDFTRERHIKPLTFESNLPVVVGVDFGYNNFALVATQVDKYDCLRIFNEAIWKRLTTAQAVDRMRQLPYADRIEMIACDPAGDSTNLHSGDKDVNILRHAFPNARVMWSTRPEHRNPEWRASRIRDRLWSASGESRLAVDPSCKETIAMFDLSKYPEQRGAKAPKQEPVKDGTVDHIRDALGYLEVCRFHIQPAQFHARRPI